MEPHDASTSLLRGQRASYRRGRFLGSGSRAIVYAVRDEEGVECAAKVLRPGLRTARSLAAEVQAHRDLWAQARSAPRWCVPILDHGQTEDGRPFYVMPLYDGHLGAHLHADAPLLQRLDLLVQAAGCVEHLHAAMAPSSLVHGHLKPTDFLLSRRGERWAVLLADQGLLRLAAPDTRSVAPGFAAPEQWGASPVLPDASLDVFASACLVYRGCAGDRTPLVATAPSEEETVVMTAPRRRSPKRPVEGASGHALTAMAQELMEDLEVTPALSQEELEHLRMRMRASLREVLSKDRLDGVVDAALGELGPVLIHALAPDPSQRTTTSAELRRQLGRTYDLLATAAGEPGWTPVPGASKAGAPALVGTAAPSSGRPVLFGAAVLVLGAVVGAGLAWRLGTTGSGPPSAPPRPPVAAAAVAPALSASPARPTPPASSVPPVAPAPAATPAPVRPTRTPSQAAARPAREATSTPAPTAALPPVEFSVRVRATADALILIDGETAQQPSPTITARSGRPTSIVLRKGAERVIFELRVKATEQGASLMVYRDGAPVLGRSGESGSSIALHLGIDGAVDVR